MNDTGDSQPSQSGDGNQGSQQVSGEGVSQSDPVKKQYGEDTDLYDIATWEPRTNLDRLAVTITGGLRAVRSKLLVTLALVLFLGQLVVAGALVLEEPLLGVLAVISVLPALFLAVYLWYRDPTRREPLALLAITFLLSMFFASFAAIVNSSLLGVFELVPVIGLPLFYFLVVGPIEETVKWLAIRVHAYNSGRFRTVVDGVVYGAVAGLGFAAIENLFYIVFFSITETPTGVIVERQYAIEIAAARLFVGPGHVIFSAWAGFYLGLAKFNPAQKGPIVVKGLLIAVFIHATYNTFVTIVPTNAIAFLLFVAVYHGFWFGLLYRKVSTYRDLYQNTPDSAGSGVDELQIDR